jgi:hypothetical protein
MEAMMYSVSNRRFSGGTRLFLAAGLLALCVSAAHAQTQIPMDMFEPILRSQFSSVPQAEFHRVFQQFVNTNFHGRTFIYQSEIEDFTASFVLSLISNGTVAAWEKNYPKPQGQASRADPVFPATHQLTADTKLYANQDFEAAVLATLKKGTGVQFKQYGDYTDLDGETAKWAQISIAGGQTGWVFSGYLQQK